MHQGNKYQRLHNLEPQPQDGLPSSTCDASTGTGTGYISGSPYATGSNNINNYGTGMLTGPYQNSTQTGTETGTAAMDSSPATTTDSTLKSITTSLFSSNNAPTSPSSSETPSQSTLIIAPPSSTSSTNGMGIAATGINSTTGAQQTTLSG
ncbi:predicted protein [Sclerotinia sclerotiorum 1980 UF-70]|uniref:Uncharacterized protein n=1 Tax=Sclerotinia sclerotiorum (strain ATCC 18683 / 1980 / Ss-1) TaxID=665079 RepID=A7ERE0_SCLS1|nr:predicted protein [Sclerotinia sclerotiorum 1980 UF-70]EDN92032.1 predicted protein [Sclerotinia sclerotiorum 1980 UF-70]